MSEQDGPKGKSVGLLSLISFLANAVALTLVFTTEVPDYLPWIVLLATVIGLAILIYRQLPRPLEYRLVVLIMIFAVSVGAAGFMIGIAAQPSTHSQGLPPPVPTTSGPAVTTTPSLPPVFRKTDPENPIRLYEQYFQADLDTTAPDWRVSSGLASSNGPFDLQTTFDGNLYTIKPSTLMMVIGAPEYDLCRDAKGPRQSIRIQADQTLAFCAKTSEGRLAYLSVKYINDGQAGSKKYFEISATVWERAR